MDDMFTFILGFIFGGLIFLPYANQIKAILKRIRFVLFGDDK